MRQPETRTTRLRTTSRQLSLDFGPDGKCSNRGRMLHILNAVAAHPGISRSMGLVLRAIDDSARCRSYWDGTHYAISQFVGSKSHHSVRRWISQLRAAYLLDVERVGQRWITDGSRRVDESRDAETVYRFRIQWDALIEMVEGWPQTEQVAQLAEQDAQLTEQKVHPSSLCALKRLPPPPEHNAAASTAHLEREPREGEAEVVGRIRQKLDAPDGPLGRIKNRELPIDVAGRILDRAERESVGPGLLHTWLMKGTAEQSAADRSPPPRCDHDTEAVLKTIRDVRRRIHRADPDGWRKITAAVDPNIRRIVTGLGGWATVQQMRDADLAAAVRQALRSQHPRRIREADP